MLRPSRMAFHSQPLFPTIRIPMLVPKRLPTQSSRRSVNTHYKRVPLSRYVLRVDLKTPTERSTVNG